MICRETYHKGAEWCANLIYHSHSRSDGDNPPSPESGTIFHNSPACLSLLFSEFFFVCVKGIDERVFKGLCCSISLEFLIAY